MLSKMLFDCLLPSACLGSEELVARGVEGRGVVESDVFDTVDSSVGIAVVVGAEVAVVVAVAVVVTVVVVVVGAVVVVVVAVVVDISAVALTAVVVAAVAVINCTPFLREEKQFFLDGEGSTSDLPSVHILALGLRPHKSRNGIGSWGKICKKLQARISKILELDVSFLRATGM